MRSVAMLDPPRVGDHALAAMSRWGYVLCLLVTISLGLTDLLIANVNISIGYTLPVILCALLTRRATPWSLVLLVVLSTVAVYLLKPIPGLPDGIARLGHYRMVNRLLVMGAIVGVALLSRRMDRLMHGWKRMLLGLPAGDQGEEMFIQVDRLLVAIGAVALLVTVFCIDLWAPPYINLPILYALPLVLMSWSCQARMLWILTPVVLLMPLAGLAIDLWVNHYTLPRYVIFNRLLATATALAVAVLLQLWIGLLSRHIKRHSSTESWGT